MSLSSQERCTGTYHDEKRKIDEPAMHIKMLPTPASSALIENRILLIRGQKVIIDADLARLYGVATRALNQAAKRNKPRFPPDFMFQLTSVEKHEVVTKCDHLSQLKFSKALPFAFTEHGAIQAANVLNSSEAAEVGVYVVRAFVRLREMVMTDKMLALRLDDLEHRVELLGLKHGDLEHNTTVQIKEIVDALRQLMATPAQTRKRPIGFVIPGDA